MEAGGQPIAVHQLVRNLKVNHLQTKIGCLKVVYKKEDITERGRYKKNIFFHWIWPLDDTTAKEYLPNVCEQGAPECFKKM